MARELEVIKTDVFTNEEKTELNAEIDRIIEAHKNNRQEINRLVFESVSAMTAADEADEELSSKGFLSRLWGGITGSNQRLQNKINKNRAAAQYASQQTLQKLAEQNLMSFDLITAVNNKLNASLTAVDSEFRNIYDGLAKFLRHNKNELARLETRLEKVERNVNLLTWQNSIEYQEFNGEEYIDMDAPSKIACLVSDFYEITKGEWSTSDLLLLKTAMATIDLQPKDKVNYFLSLQSIVNNENLKNKLLGGKFVGCIDNPGYLISASVIKKLESLNNEDSHMVDTVAECLQSNGIKPNRDSICENLTKKYMTNEAGINIDTDVESFDLILDLLYNLRQMVEEGILVGETRAIKQSEPVEEKPNIDELYEEGRKHYSIAEEYEDDEEYRIAGELFKKAADNGHVGATLYLGFIYDFGQGVETNVSEAMKWYTISAEQGSAEAQLFLGWLYKDNGDFQTALKWFKKSAQKDNPSALYCLAEYYYEGKSVEQNIEKAIELYKRSAEKGDWEAQFKLGKIYESGDHVCSDYKKAADFYEMAAKQEYAPAEVSLGLLYKHGKGVERDYKKAVSLFKSASDKGDGRGLNNLANMYKDGLGVESNLIKATELYKLAIEKGYATAAYNLGLLNKKEYEDYEEALMWFKKADEMGHPDAKAAIDRIKHPSKHKRKYTASDGICDAATAVADFMSWF